MPTIDVPAANLEADLAARYFQTASANGCWLSFHLQVGHETEFGHQLLHALAACEHRLGGLGFALAEDLANTAYTPARINPDAWTQGFQQLLQKLAEVLVLRALVEAPWPAGTTFHHEPLNRRTGKRPELAVEMPDQLYLFEVKCPSLVEHQRLREQNPHQVPARTAYSDMLRGNAEPEEPTTWPRDNVLKDFLESAQEKFVGFADKPTIGVVVIAWDAHMYEPISALTHTESGLLTEASFHRRDNARVEFEAVDGVIVLNHLAVLHAGAQQTPRHRQPDAFGFGDDPLVNVWCRNLGGDDLSEIVLHALNAVPVTDTAGFADYSAKDFVLWFNPDKIRKQVEASNWKRDLFAGAACLHRH